MERKEMIARIAQMIAKQMRKVNFALKHDSFSNEYHDFENQLEGMIEVLSVITGKYRILWEDPEEMAGYDGIEIEDETWLVL